MTGGRVARPQAAQPRKLTSREITRPVEDQFYGDRSGQFEDPWGHRWSVQTHVEDVPPDEMEKRAATAMSDSQG